MTDRKGKGKAKTIRLGKRKKTQQTTGTADEPQYERQIRERDRANQRTPPTDPSKFSNLYSELKFPDFQRKSLHVERKLQIPAELQKLIEDRINQQGWKFLDRELILVTEEVIEEILHFSPKPPGKDSYEKAKKDKHTLDFDWDAVLRVISHILTLIATGYMLYLPKLIRKYISQTHHVGNLAFPCLITQLGLRAKNHDWDLMIEELDSPSEHSEEEDQDPPVEGRDE
ncbi:hypothetical protein AHAS_Ahas09G0103300 [Arachis hypogaea]